MIIIKDLKELFEDRIKHFPGIRNRNPEAKFYIKNNRGYIEVTHDQYPFPISCIIKSRVTVKYYTEDCVNLILQK